MQERKGKASAPKKNKKREKEEKQSVEPPEIVVNESNVESDAEMVIDDQPESTPQQRAGMGPAVQSKSGKISASPMGAGARTPIEVEQEEEELEAEMAMEINLPTQKELGMRVGWPDAPSPDNTYSTTVTAPTPIPIQPTASSSMPTPVSIYSTLTITSPIPSTLMPFCDAIPDMLRYALWQGPHPTLLTQQLAFVQSTMSVQGPITSSMVSPATLYIVHLDPVDFEFFRKAEECQGRQKNVLLGEGQVDPYITISGRMHRNSDHEASANPTARGSRKTIVS